MNDPLRLNYSVFIELTVATYWQLLDDGRYNLYGSVAGHTLWSFVEGLDIVDFETNHKNPANGVITDDEGVARSSVIGQTFVAVTSGAATEETISARFGAVTGSPITASSSGDTVVYTPASGKRIRLKWLGLSSPSSNTANVLVKIILGSTEIYRWSMGAPGAFAHGSVREGTVDGVLKINLDISQAIHVNVDIEEF